MPSEIPQTVQWQPTGQTIGEGGQGTVRKVRPREGSPFPPGDYAMKILNKTASEQARSRFVQEIRALRGETDPRIVRIVDFAPNKQQPNPDFWYYVMPFVAGMKPLSKIIGLPTSPFLANAPKCILFIVACAEALAKVHAKKITHRDLTPNNVLVHPETLQPLIIDFGCCQTLDQGQSITLTDENVGTPDFMAPECGSGSEHTPGPQSDVYSLGKLLWSMVTGQTAFHREQPAFRAKSLSRVLPDHPDTWHLTSIFERTIRRDPKNRFKDMNAMATFCRSLASDIVGKYPPLERLSEQCPSCGERQLRDLPQSETYDRGWTSDEVRSIKNSGFNSSYFLIKRCESCGLLTLRGRATLERRIKAREDMD